MTRPNQNVLPAENDRTIAFKAIGIVAGLSGNAKSVATAIISHFNTKTGRCDPSVNRIAELLGINRATVLRATAELCSDKWRLFTKFSHGGNRNCASYQPEWGRFREIVAAFEECMTTGQIAPELAPTANEKVAEMQPTRSQNCDVDGRKTATQTHCTYSLNEPFEEKNTKKENPEPDNSEQEQPNPAPSRNTAGLGKGNNVDSSQQGYRGKSKRIAHSWIKQPSKREAASDAAKDRVDKAMLAMGYEFYSAALSYLGEAQFEIAAVDEMRRRGSGIQSIADMLRETQMVPMPQTCPRGGVAVGDNPSTHTAGCLA